MIDLVIYSTVASQVFSSADRQAWPLINEATKPTPNSLCSVTENLRKERRGVLFL
jgi:hypothetical protein